MTNVDLIIKALNTDLMKWWTVKEIAEAADMTESMVRRRLEKVLMNDGTVEWSHQWRESYSQSYRGWQTGSHKVRCYRLSRQWMVAQLIASRIANEVAVEAAMKNGGAQ